MLSTSCRKGVMWLGNGQQITEDGTFNQFEHFGLAWRKLVIFIVDELMAVPLV